MLTTSAYVKGPDGEVRKDVPWDQQGYSYRESRIGNQDLDSTEGD